MKFITTIFWLKYLKLIELKNKEFENHNLTTVILEKIIKNYKLKYNNNLKSIEGYTTNNSYLDLNLTQIQSYINLFKLYPLTEENITIFPFIKIPKISIIIPLKNSFKNILKLHKSIQEQSLKEIEIIYVDDCSSDDTTQLIKKLQKKDRRIILLRNKINKGPFYSRNKAAIFARGEFIQFIDSDDILYNYFMKI